MDSIGTTDEPGAGIVECIADGSSPVSECMGATADERHSLDDVFDSGHVDGVATPYWQSSIVKV